MNNESFHETLRQLADRYAHEVYRLTKSFPKEEIYGMTSQLRRAALSVVLNYVEGYTRSGKNDYARFMEIAFGSLKESCYLIEFARDEGYATREQTDPIIEIADRIAAMLWGMLKQMRR